MHIRTEAPKDNVKLELLIIFKDKTCPKQF